MGIQAGYLQAGANLETATPKRLTLFLFPVIAAQHINLIVLQEPIWGPHQPSPR